MEEKTGAAISYERNAGELNGRKTRKQACEKITTNGEG